MGAGVAAEVFVEVEFFFLDAGVVFVVGDGLVLFGGGWDDEADLDGEGVFSGGEGWWWDGRGGFLDFFGFGF